MDLYSLGGSTYAGKPVPIGAEIAVIDPQGVQCGGFTVTTAGWYGVIHCYGDDPSTPGIDEGAWPGDVLRFTIEGVAAETEAVSHWSVPVPAATTITWQNEDRWEVNLHARAMLAVTHTITSSVNPSDLGQPVTFTTTVTGSGPDGETPTGDVEFWADGTALGGPVTLANGQASISPANLVGGLHEISATYRGDVVFTSSMVTLTQRVLMHAQPSNTWVNFYSTGSTYLGEPVPIGAQIVAFDPQGVPCGDMIVETVGWYGIMPCYGDDPSAPGDQGAVLGDILRFTIDGRAAKTEVVTLNGAAMAPGTVVAWTPEKGLWQVNLHVLNGILPPAVPDLRAGTSANDVVLSWTDVGGSVHHYEVWRGSAPYFTPDTNEGTLLAASIPLPANTGDPISFVDHASHLGDVATQDYYVVLAVDIAGQKSVVSSYVGVFDFELLPGTTSLAGGILDRTPADSRR
jgi:hypothetical protein